MDDETTSTRPATAAGATAGSDAAVRPAQPVVDLTSVANPRRVTL